MFCYLGFSYYICISLYLYILKKNQATFSFKAKTNLFNTNIDFIKMIVSGDDDNSFIQLLYKFIDGKG